MAIDSSMLQLYGKPIFTIDGTDDDLQFEQVIDFSGGEDDYRRSTLIAQNQCQNLINVIVRDNYEAWTRPGADRFAPAVGTTMPANVMAAKTSCWKCGGETRTVLGVELLTEKMFPGFGNVRIEIDAIDAHRELGLQWIETFLPAGMLRKWGVGEIKIRQSKAAGQAYLSNGCVHCDALYGRFFSPDLWYDVAPLFEIRVAVEPWMAEFPGRDGGLKRWWFDTGPSTTSALAPSASSDPAEAEK